jgi:hypothetical protein
VNKLAERIAEAVTVHARKRVPFEVVATAAYASDSSLLTAPDRRDRLAQAIGALASAGSIRLPASASGWDQSARPALPRWVERISEPTAARPVAPPRAWVDELAFAATTSLSPAERILLTRLNDFLRDGGDGAELIPLRERSYELFREEKRLDNLTESRLVVSGLLSLEAHLRAYPTPPPMPIVELGTAPWALIVENSATFSSLRTVLRHLAEGDRTVVGWLCLGAGKHVIQSITSLAERIAETRHRVDNVFYFGDLDLEGLEIAQRTSDRGVAAGLPPLQPATRLYSALLQRPDRVAEPTDPARVHASVSWLPDSLAHAAATMLLRQRCLRQEALPLPAIREVICTNLRDGTGSCKLTANSETIAVKRGHT